ncbi:MAG: deoxyguanosinetriphosphate triphosphohydrolase [Chromatiales bacterium]|nr:deoxyguanosinetriphosphate triphosphohydrolase [Chromatiales bacterium]
MSGPVPLAPWAAHEEHSRGRCHPQPPHPYRGEFQRDRDRIIHSTAFRRLVYKTQVFINHEEGDLYRTRLTHSLEVAQVVRTAARALALNEQLAEAIALAHDLGHTPFGHAGQDALNACMQPWGGFEHNLQSLRVVDELERKYAAFPGLNLCWETREGILKHCSRRDALQLGSLGRRFLERRQPGLEAQLVNLCDEIAYNHHDIDDGLRSGLIAERELAEVGLFGEHYDAVCAIFPGLSGRVRIHETVRRMIDTVVGDLVVTTRERVAGSAPDSIDAVREAGRPLAAFSPAMAARHQELKRFLRERLYYHPQVRERTERAQCMLTAVFERFMEAPDLMPAEHAARAIGATGEAADVSRARAVADYVAGMTDRYALSTYRRLVDPRAEL